MMLTPESDGSFREKKVTLILLSDMLLVCDKKHSDQYHVVKVFAKKKLKFLFVNFCPPQSIGG
jgi:hypothetical protein